MWGTLDVFGKQVADVNATSLLTLPLRPSHGQVACTSCMCMHLNVNVCVRVFGCAVCVYVCVCALVYVCVCVCACH